MSLFKEVAEKCKPRPTPIADWDIEQIDRETRADLREIQNFYGSWEALRKVIKELEDNDKDAAWERHELDKLK